MQIVDFTKEWMEKAKTLVAENLEEERRFTHLLPTDAPLPALDFLCENGLGAAAVEGERLLGFLGAYGPWKPVFTTPDTAGVFSPLHAHAVQKENRLRIWQRLYQAAAEKWVKTGAASHGIALFAHDEDAQKALYMYGFGVRCMDFVQDIRNAETPPASFIRELAPEEQHLLNPLRLQLTRHLASSPCFMRDTDEMIARWLQMRKEHPPRMFVYEREGRIIAYMEAAEEGENYLTQVPGFMNICGAYCLPEYRGTGISQMLVQHMAAVFGQEGCTRLGVDCESFNPTALHFWGRHFIPYTHSVVRRIDENALG